MLAILFVGLTLNACHDDDDADSGTPVITGVRVPDPAKADSLFTKSGPGQIIAIIGQNLGHALKVYINDQEVYFNPTMNTNHSLIVTVPTETDGFRLTAFDSTLDSWHCRIFVQNHCSRSGNLTTASHLSQIGWRLALYPWTQLD